MFDTKSYYSIFKSIIADKAKAEHKPTLSSLESMKAYQQATKATGKAKFIGMDDDLACYQIDFTL